MQFMKPAEKRDTRPATKRAMTKASNVIKRVFGFAKVRYRGLDKNAHRLFVTCALANLFMARRYLWRCQGMSCCWKGA